MANVMADRAIENGTVATIDTPIPAKRRKLMALNPPLKDPESMNPLTMPAPTTPPIWQWVVETGIANSFKLAMRTVTAATHSTQKPMEDVIRLVDLDPIICITRLPYNINPREIPRPPYSKRKYGLESAL